MLHGQHALLSFGGPVQPTSLHYVHDLADEIPGSEQISAGVYWGGDFSFVQTLAGSTALAERDIRFFLGYAGWGPGQLEAELATNDWILGNSSRDLIFKTDADSVWGTVLERLGGHYALLANFPSNPRLN
jgi:putative transcriptional regulator